MSDTETMTDAAEDRAEAQKLAAETLAGDIRDALLTHVRSMETPWSKLGEREQQNRIDAVNAAARELVRRAVRIVAERGFDHVPAVLGKFQVDGGTIKGAFEALVNEANVVALSDHQKKAVVILLCDVGAYMGERAAVKPDPDEPEMFDEDGDETPAEAEAEPA